MDNRDYIIDDTDGYNWVSVPKPLSTYSQEELAEQLITEKHDTGDEQRIRLTGNIGGILTTDECDTPEEFIEKYQTILNEAGFVKRPVARQKHKLTVKPLSKASISDYTQEELAHLIMDEKTELEDFQVKYSGYEFSSVGLNSVEEFLDKYQDHFYKLRIKDENGKKAKKPQTTKQLVEALEEYKVTELPLSKVSLSDYTQEELAHLLMDNKSNVEDFNIKYNAYEFSSVGLNSIEEFLDKYQDKFYELRIKDENGNLAKKPEIDTIEEETNEIEEAEEVKDIESTFTVKEDADIMPLLADMIDKKIKHGDEIKAIYNGFELSTEGCTSYKDILDKYADIVLTAEDNKVHIALKDAEVERGTIIFSMPRGNLYNGTSSAEEEKLEELRIKSQEYRLLYAESETLDFSNSEAVYNWLERLIPYFNTHALNLNPGINSEISSPVRNLIALFEEHGYTTNPITEENMKDYYKYTITIKLSELEKYGFFITDYKEKRFKGLDSTKTSAMVEVAYLEKKLEQGKQGIEYIDKDIEYSRIDKELRVAEINRAIDMIDYDNNQDVNKVSYFENAAKTEVEKNAVEAYKELVRVPNVENMQKANLEINKIFDEDPNSVLATQLQQSAIFRLGYKRDNVEVIPVKEQMDLKAEYLKRIGEITSKQEELESRLEGQRAEILRLTDVITAKLEKLAVENGIESAYLEKKAPVEEAIEEVIEEPVVDEEDKTFEEIFEESRQANVEEQSEENDEVQFIDVDDLVTEEEKEPEIEYDFSLAEEDDTLNEFVAVRSFKKINRTLYERISNIKVKEVIKTALDKIRENKKAICVCIGIAGVVALTAIAGHAIKSNVSEKAAQPDLNQDRIEQEATVEDSETDIEKAVDNAMLEAAEETEVTMTEAAAPGGNSTAPADSSEAVAEETAEDNNTVSLEDATNNAIESAIDGSSNIYASAADALVDTNGLNAYTPSWETAKGGDFYTQNEDGTLNKLSQDEALDYYNNNSGDLVQSIENDGSVIGYVSLDNAQGKGM